MGRENRNSGMGRNFDREYTINNICEATREAIGRGSDTEEKLHSVLVSMSEYMREEYGIRDMDQITSVQYESWAQSLVERVNQETMSAGTVVDYVSMANTMWGVFDADGSRGLHINPSELGVSKTRISNEDKAIDRETFDALREAAHDRWREIGDIKDAATYHMLGVGWETGMRHEEIIMNHIGNKDLSQNIMHLADYTDGAKNHHGREYESVRELEMTREAQQFLQEHQHIFTSGNFIPSDMTYKQMEDYTNNRLRYFNEQVGNTQMWHGLRHNYAHESYAQKWEAAVGQRIECPVRAGLFGADWIHSVQEKTGLSYREVQRVDRECRKEMMEELGHHRSKDSSAYLGR